jgi:hypothetical protein
LKKKKFPSHNHFFSHADDISLQLNQSDSTKPPQPQNGIVKQPLKHPKMRIKQPQNRYQPQPPIEVNKKQSNANAQREPVKINMKPAVEVIPQQRIQAPIAVVNDGQKRKAIKFREKQLSQDVASRREKMRENGEPIVEGFEDVENNGNYNELMNKISMMELPRQYKLNPEEVVSFHECFHVNHSTDDLTFPDGAITKPAKSPSQRALRLRVLRRSTRPAIHAGKETRLEHQQPRNTKRG